MHQQPDINQLTEQQLRALAGQLLSEAQQKDGTIERIQRENTRYKLQNEQYKHEIAILRRHQFARKSEVLNRHQHSLKDVLTRLPTQKNSQIDELLPHNWEPPVNM